MKVIATLFAAATILVFAPACSKKLYGFKKGQEYTEEGTQMLFHITGYDHEFAREMTIVKTRYRIVEVGKDYIVANMLSRLVVLEDSGEVVIDEGKAEQGHDEYNNRIAGDENLIRNAGWWKLGD